MKNLILALIAGSLTACAIGPLVTHETGRSVGKGNFELGGGVGQMGYNIKWTFGATENLDLGIQYESTSLGIRAKYAIVNGEKGWAAAVAGGVGTSLGGTYYNGDLIGSYFFENGWEPYAAVRFVHAKNEESEFKDSETGNVMFVIDAGSYDYGQGFIGTRYWFQKGWYVSAEASKPFSTSSKLKFDGNGILLSMAFGYRFL